jgi:coproporphyrinogen III oxidase-like Fe-S oxidoreductase
MGFLMLGGPGETRETVEASLSFADSLKLDTLKITVGIRIYPDTDLAKAAVRDSLVSPEDDLLFPRFYMVQEIEGWIRETVNSWMNCHPNWTM